MYKVEPDGTVSFAQHACKDIPPVTSNDPGMVEFAGTQFDPSLGLKIEATSYKYPTPFTLGEIICMIKHGGKTIEISREALNAAIESTVRNREREELEGIFTRAKQALKDLGINVDAPGIEAALNKYLDASNAVTAHARERLPEKTPPRSPDLLQRPSSLQPTSQPQ